MEKGKRYKLTSALERTLYAPVQEKLLQKDKDIRAMGNRVILEAGTEVEVLDIDMIGVALLHILSGRYTGHKFPSSPRTQQLFEDKNVQASNKAA